MDLTEMEWEVMDECIRLRIRTSERLLWAQQWTFRLFKRQDISWLTERLLASQDTLCSMELVRNSNEHLLNSKKA
jgi:hypothetical protein